LFRIEIFPVILLLLWMATDDGQKKKGSLDLRDIAKGINSVREITRVCGELGVKHLTLYTFSSENWSRPKKEVSALMTLLLKTIRKEIVELDKKNVEINCHRVP